MMRKKQRKLEKNGKQKMSRMEEMLVLALVLEQPRCERRVEKPSLQDLQECEKTKGEKIQ